MPRPRFLTAREADAALAPKQPGACRVTRDGEPASELLPSASVAFGWLLGHQPMSCDWAARYEGWAIEREPAEPWSLAEAAQHRRMAGQNFNHGHGPGTSSHYGAWRDAEEEQLVRDNCGACALEGWGELSGPDAPHGLHQPNTGFARLYVEAGRPLPRRWLPAFVAELNADDNPGHHDALLRSLATWGLRTID